MANKRMVERKSFDMTKAEDMALNISWCIAEQVAGYLEIIMAGMTKEGINRKLRIYSFHLRSVQNTAKTHIFISTIVSVIRISLMLVW